MNKLNVNGGEEKIARRIFNCLLLILFDFYFYLFWGGGTAQRKTKAAHFRNQASHPMRMASTPALTPRPAHSSRAYRNLSSLSRLDSRATRAHRHLPGELAPVPFGFVVARVQNQCTFAFPAPSWYFGDASASHAPYHDVITGRRPAQAPRSYGPSLSSSTMAAWSIC